MGAYTISSRTRYLLISVGAVWIAAAGFFFTKMMAFETQPGVGAHPPAVWPRASGVQLDGNQQTLIVFLHPKCSCSRASVAQVVKLQKQLPHRFQTILVVWQPTGADASWGNLGFSGVGELAEYRLIWDRGGRLASLFDAHTSGQALVYDAAGRLRFSGGVTSVRANSEDGPAFALVAKALSGDPGPDRLPVFGCSL